MKLSLWGNQADEKCLQNIRRPSLSATRGNCGSGCLLGGAGLMETTLNKIRAKHPCTDGWAKLLKHLGKTEADDELVDLITILDSNGLDDALWCLRAVRGQDELKRQLACKFALQVIHLWDAPDVVKEYLNTQNEGIRKEAYAYADADAYAADADAYAYAAPYAAYAAAYAAYAAPYADADARAAYAAAARASYAAYASYADADADADARADAAYAAAAAVKKQEEIFREMLG